jgi:hypothetical protein
VGEYALAGVTFDAEAGDRAAIEMLGTRTAIWLKKSRRLDHLRDLLISLLSIRGNIPVRIVVGTAMTHDRRRQEGEGVVTVDGTDHVDERPHFWREVD